MENHIKSRNAIKTNVKPLFLGPWGPFSWEGKWSQDAPKTASKNDGKMEGLKKAIESK